MCEEMKRRRISPRPMGRSFVGSVSDLCRHIRILDPKRFWSSVGNLSVMISWMNCESFSMFGYELLSCLVSAHHLRTSCESAKGPGALPLLIVLTEISNFLVEHRSLIVFNCIVDSLLDVDLVFRVDVSGNGGSASGYNFSIMCILASVLVATGIVFKWDMAFL